MKDRFTKFDGIVTARNSKTGELIFDKLHNTIVINGCLKALSGLSVGSNQHSEFYMIKRNDESVEPKIAEAMDANINDLKVARYNFTYTDTIAGVTDHNVNKNDEIGDISGYEHMLYDPDLLKTATYENLFEVADFRNTSYTTEDIGDADEAKEAFLFYDERTYSTFLRLRLELSNTKHVIPARQLEPGHENWNAQDLTYINSVMLYLQDPSTPSSNLYLFSRLKFPPIPFFGNLAVDFEYRIYI
jgi:hypothetical protein